MDGDGHNAKAFAWNENANRDASKPVDAFDPAAVLRAIEDENEDEKDAQPRSASGLAREDLGAALRAAMAYDADVLSEDRLDETVPQAERVDDDVQAEDAYEDDFAASDEHDDVDDWDDADAEEVGELPSCDGEVARSDDPGLDDGWAQDEEPHEAEPAASGFPTMDELDVPGRKPRIALMGEFSAGKSTLSNLLIGAAPLPTKVTATQLPPVWISWGDGAPYREDLEGETHPIDIARLSDIDPSETRVIRIFEKSEILEHCDIIDMPGISDPNMASDVWERVIGKADGVIWCTHATQAWRQSEAAVWESLDPKLFETSLLLVTRFDKLHGESDRARVMRRVERETEGLFTARLPISLTEALAAGDDEQLLERSGSARFRNHLLDLIAGLAYDLGSDLALRPGQERTRETLGRDGMVARIDAGPTARGITPSRILPRRVRPVSEHAPDRLARGEHDAGL
jgi:hypothetical protein